MTLKKAIEKIDILKPNAFTNDQKTEWVSTVEGNIKKVSDKWSGETTPFVNYTYTDDMNSQLIAQSPHDQLYLLYLASMIDFWNKEYVSYSNSQIMFNSAMDEYERHIKSLSIPTPTKITGLWG